MKAFIELDELFNKDNLDRIVRCVDNYIETCQKFPSDVTGFSLMTVRDALDKKFTDEVLRSRGYILNVAQFKEDCVKYLELASKDPVAGNPLLKRLHRAYVALTRNYSGGIIVNAALVSEIKQELLEVIMQAYTSGTHVGSKMPAELVDRIVKFIEAEIVAMNTRWLANTLPTELKNEWMTLMSNQLLKDWKSGQLVDCVRNQLQAEKADINSIKALMKYFRQQKLPEAMQEQIRSTLITSISNDIDASLIQPHSALGATFRAVREHIMQNSNYAVISSLVQRWYANQLAPEVEAQLGKYVESTIENLKLDLDLNLTQEFERVTVGAFWDKVHTNKYPSKELRDAIQRFTVDLAKNTFLYSFKTSSAEIALSQIEIIKTAMARLHDKWIEGKLTQNETDFIKTSVFSSLEKLDEKVRNQIWSNQQVAKLAEENTQLRVRIDRLESLVAQLTTQAEKSTVQTAENSVNMQTSSSFNLFRTK